MKIREIIGGQLHVEVERLIGPDTPDDLRAELMRVFDRDPPVRMSPEEMQAMYSPDYADEVLQRRKQKADVEKAEADAALAWAQTAAQRAGIKRPN